MADQTTKLDVHAREAAHSRETRRLRRSGQVPGVLYGGDEGPVPFPVADRTLRHALAMLCGEAAMTFRVAATNNLEYIPPIPKTLPSELLEARPDIAGARLDEPRRDAR